MSDDLEGLPQQVRDMAQYSREMMAKGRPQEPQKDTQAAGEPANPEAPKPQDPAAEPGQKTDGAEPTPSAESEWRRKHDALFGKYSVEVREVRDQIRTLRADNARVLAENAKLKEDLARLKEAPPEKEAPVKPAAGSVDPKDFEDYDENFQKLASVVNRLEADNEALRQELAKARDSISSQIAPIAEQTARQEYEGFLARLAEHVPHMAEINVDPEFLSWLDAEQDPYTGDTMKAILERMVKSRNIAKTAKIFNDFAAQSKGKYAPKPAQAPASRPRNIQPEQGGAQQPPINPGKKNWTTAEVKQFYAELAQGKWMHRETEAEAMKREIFKAGSEGRIA